MQPGLYYLSRVLRERMLGVCSTFLVLQTAHEALRDRDLAG